MMTATLDSQLQALRLSQMKAHWNERERRSIDLGWTPGYFLSQLCERALEHRLQQRHKRYLKDAKLPAGKSMSTLEFESLEGVNPAAIRLFGEQHDWIEQGDNLLLFGASGVGKTPVAAAIGRERVSHGIRGRFYGATERVQRLQKAKQALMLNEWLLKLDRYRFIIIDDIGYVNRDEQETRVLFELIAHRYERVSLIITANQPFSKWQRVFADESMTVAAVDRLIHHGNIIELEGEQSYRRKTAHSRNKTASDNKVN